RVGVGGGGGAFRASFWGIGWLGAADRHRLPDGAKSTSRRRRSKTGAGKAATILHCCSGMHLTRPAWLVGLLHARGPSSAANCTDNGAEERHDARGGGSARQTQEANHRIRQRRHSAHRVGERSQLLAGNS